MLPRWRRWRYYRWFSTFMGCGGFSLIRRVTLVLPVWFLASILKNMLRLELVFARMAIPPDVGIGFVNNAVQYRIARVTRRGCHGLRGISTRKGMYRQRQHSLSICQRYTRANSLMFGAFLY